MSSPEERRTRGRVRLEVVEAGRSIATRRATNVVLRGGAELVARRLAGLEASPFSAVGVGFGTESADVGATALTPPPAAAGVAPEALTSPVVPEDITVATDRADAVVVSLTTVFHLVADLTDVTEAGLLGGDRLYNQVVFEPVSLRVGQDVTFFWEIDLPFGH